MSNLAQIYSSTVGTAPVAESSGDNNKITYACMTQDRLANNRRNLPVILPHVDRAVMIDGGSQDGTVEYLKSLGPKVEVYQRAWDDSFANQYNEYLKHVKEGWVLLCDDDELPSETMLLSLRKVIEQSENSTKFDHVEYRANDITYVEGDWENRTDNGPCEYYRKVFFKWNPNLKYTVHLHQALQGLRGPAAQCKEHYYHIKSTKDQLRNSCRNYFISGEWPPGSRAEGIKTPEWNEMKEILAVHHPEVSLFGHVNGLMVSGNLSQEFRDWVEKYRTHNEGVDGETSGELRAFATYLDLLEG